MATIAKFEDLTVWQKARTLALKIYQLTFIEPLLKDFRLKDQMRGSAGSIMDNIAEGFDRGSRLEFINSLGISKGETGELKSQLYRCLDVNYISQQIFDELYKLVDEVAKMIARFIEYLNRLKAKSLKIELMEKTENFKLKTGNLTPLVGIIMGSDSDLNIMKDAAAILKEFNISFELTIVSAHRTPMRMVEYATIAATRGLKVIIAGAGGAAHLPGMVASLTTLPVIGVPVKSSNSIDGWDSILSILQMPNGVPVATVALNAAKNAGIIAAQIIGTSDEKVAEQLKTYKADLEKSVLEKAQHLSKEWTNNFDK